MNLPARCLEPLCRSVFAAALLLAAIGCTTIEPKRPFVVAEAGAESQDCPAVIQNAEADGTTPKRSPYALHFIEFDDQGWLHPDRDDGKPGQIDCVISDLSQKTRSETGAVAFVYVHGWRHTAQDGDRDVAKFQDFLAAQAGMTTRHVVGIYIGWQGKSLEAPVLEYLTFWSRKNAAHRVAEGRVREVFSRIRSLRSFYNQVPDSETGYCGSNLGKPSHRCRLRTVMIGHSFGGLILFNSAAPYLLETLTRHRDVVELDPFEDKGLVRERGIADLVILLNPAFEASRYEAVHRAARDYRSRRFEPPLLVTLSSSGDTDTKNLFPAVRWVNTVFQFPASSDEQFQAMRRTPTHVERYLTHTLGAQGGEVNDCVGEQEEHDLRWTGFLQPALEPHKAVGTIELSPGWSRRFCKGAVLTRLAHYPAVDGEPPRERQLDAYSPVWNVLTDEKIMADHGDTNNPRLRAFVATLYVDLEKASRPNIHGRTFPATGPNLARLNRK